MIKLPTDEFKSQLYWEYAETSLNFGDMLEKYNAEILRINEPQMPEFPEWVKYITFDKNDGWWPWMSKPDYIYRIGWYTSDEDFELQPDFALTSKEILWLEHVNGNRPPSESLICLEEYK